MSSHRPDDVTHADEVLSPDEVSAHRTRVMRIVSIRRRRARVVSVAAPVLLVGLGLVGAGLTVGRSSGRPLVVEGRSTSSTSAGSAADTSDLRSCDSASPLVPAAEANVTISLSVPQTVLLDASGRIGRGMTATITNDGDHDLIGSDGGRHDVSLVAFNAHGQPASEPEGGLMSYVTFIVPAHGSLSVPAVVAPSLCGDGGGRIVDGTYTMRALVGLTEVIGESGSKGAMPATGRSWRVISDPVRVNFVTN